MSSLNKKTLIADIRKIRNRARKHMQEGAVTDNYNADRNTVINVLNEALATELVCVLRYKRHYFMAAGIDAESVSEEFLQHAREEQEHADKIAKRIVQLGGEPDFSPDELAVRSHAEYVEGESLEEMIQEDLVAERIAIDSYREIIRFLDNNDPTTRRMMEEILSAEEEHADELAGLLKTYGSRREFRAHGGIASIRG